MVAKGRGRWLGGAWPAAPGQGGAGRCGRLAAVLCGFRGRGWRGRATGAAALSVERFPVVALERGRPLVSVVIPCYDYGRFVTEAVDSILRQTVTDLEIIVVDGGSGDSHTISVRQNRERPRTQVLFRTGRHLVGDNRNFGIERARGRYICCLDADDTLDPTYLEKALFLLETYGYDVVSAALRMFGASTDTAVMAVSTPDLHSMLQANHVFTCAVFRRLLWARAGGYTDFGLGELYVPEDWEFWIRLCALGARIRSITGEPLMNYRIHLGGSLSSMSTPMPLEKRREVVESHDRALLTAAAFDLSRAQRRRRLRAAISATALTLSMSRKAAAGHCPTLVLAAPPGCDGGAEPLLSRLTGFLVHRGWRVAVLTASPSDLRPVGLTPWFRQHTPEVYDLPRFLEPAEWRDFVAHIMISRRPDCLLDAGHPPVAGLLRGFPGRLPSVALVGLSDGAGDLAGRLVPSRELYAIALSANEDAHRRLTAAGWEEGRIRTVIGDLAPDLAHFEAVLWEAIACGRSDGGYHRGARRYWAWMSSYLPKRPRR